MKKIILPKNDVLIYKNDTELAEGFAAYLAERINKLADSAGNVNIGLSGGKTPKLLFRELAENYVSSVNWKEVNFYWVDERCVPPGDEQSNFKSAYELLLSHIDIKGSQIHRIKGEAVPIIEAERYSTEIMNNVETYEGLPSFDILLMGLGEDGHTASIFPNQISLLNSDHLCEVSAHPVTGQKRITMTGALINNSRHLYFLVSGKDKAKTTIDILNNADAAKSYPAYYIKPNFGELMWFMDESAGSLIK